MNLADSSQIDALGVVRSDLRWRIGQCAWRADSRPRQVARRLQSVPYATERNPVLGNGLKPLTDEA